MPDEAPPTPSASSPTKRWVTSAVVVVLLTAMVVYVSRTHDELVLLRRLSLQVLVVACMLQFLGQLFLNESMLLPLKTCVTRLGFWELYLVRTGGFLVGALMPVAGGLAVRLAYLRNRGLTYLDFTWATLVSNVLALLAAAVLSVAAIGVLWTLAGQPPAAVLGLSAGVLAISGAAIAAFEYLPRVTRWPRFQRWSWLAGMRSLRANRSMAVRVFVLCVIRHALNFVTFGLLARSLSGVPADFVSGGLLYALTSPVRMVNITPGNLGVTEWVVAVVGKMLAFDLAIGLIVAIAYRGVGLVAQTLGALFGSAWIAARKAS
ncbi:MAG: lysylphosphatidylglycerol synthase transmembrane domain-containing protein [Vicinamibacterales bacterium]